jgi:hypothetical protein
MAGMAVELMLFFYWNFGFFTLKPVQIQQARDDYVRCHSSKSYESPICSWTIQAHRADRRNNRAIERSYFELTKV